MLAVRMVRRARPDHARPTLLRSASLQAVQVAPKASVADLVPGHFEAGSLPTTRPLPQRRNLPVAIHEAVE